MEGIAGFGIDRVARGGVRTPTSCGWRTSTPISPLPPEAVSVTRAALDDPVSNSWLPFTGDLGLRAAISEHMRGPPRPRATTRCARSSSPAAGPRACSTCCWRRVDPGDEVVLTDPDLRRAGEPRAAGRRRAGVRAAGGRRRRVAARPRRAWRRAVTERTVALLMMSPSMPSGCVLDADDWAAVACALSSA